jgi:hypothetical protein
MSGRWVSRKAEVHVCDKPKYGESLEMPISVGDEWQCDVDKKVWRVTHVSYGDQRDPIPQGYVSESWWEEAPRPSPGTYVDH